MKKIEQRALSHVSKLKSQYQTMLGPHKARMRRIYRDVMSYKAKRKAKWSSALKMNFANQTENLITARLTAKNPKFLVSFQKPPSEIAKQYFPGNPEESPEEYEQFEKDVYQWSEVVQSYLNFAFEEYGFNKQVRMLAKSLVRYGNAYGQAGYKVERVNKMRNGKVEEVGFKKRPYIENVSFAELNFDPRYLNTEDCPAVIYSHERVRLSELHAMKDELINLDKIKYAGSGEQNIKNELYIITMQISGSTVEKRTSNLTVDKFQGYFSEDPNDPEKEGLYEIWTVNGSVVIKLKPIAEISVKSAGCFEDPEQHISVGYIEPILDAQNEYNFKINSANEFINQALNRSYFWDPSSGVDPRLLQQGSRPGGIIPVTRGMAAAREGLEELPYRNIPNEYFANQNETRRDMQSLSFTIDTTAPTGQQGFTNTATGQRLRAYESNTMYADTLKHLEELLAKLAYDLLDKIVEMADEGEDIIVDRMGKDKFKWAKPAVFDDAPLRYAIKVEVGSSSFDSIENRRDDALAKWTLAKEAMAADVQLEKEKIFEDIFGTFEGADPRRYIKQDMEPVMDLLGQAAQNPRQPSQAEREQVTEEEPSLNDPAALTEAVAGGQI